jgi:uncharacterized membrane protein SirB2
MSHFAITYMIHVSCVVASGTFFLVRGVWMLLDSPLLQHPVARIAPHIIDTILLASAIVLAITIRQYPITDDWLTVKVVLLVVYILLGTVALKRGKTKRIRSICLVLALLTFGFMVSVALSHHPLGILNQVTG